MSRYEFKLNEFSSHSRILRSLGPGHGRSLLDVGCADGELAGRLRKLGWQVTGIEPDLEDAKQSRELGIRVLEMSLEQAVEVLEERFSIVMLADVLEHTSDPWHQLRRITRLCEPDARVIISIPNIANIVPRMKLLMGTFDYEDRGIMDRTHLRFFTRKTATSLVSQAGLVCESLHVTPIPIEILAPRLASAGWGKVVLAVNARVAMFAPRLLGYQFVMECRLADFGEKAKDC